MKKILFVLLVISVSSSLFAQSGSNSLESISLRYRTDYDTVAKFGNAINVPKGSALYFEIFVNGTDTLDGYLYKRYYGDESYRIDSFRTSSHVYDEPGGYYFRIEVTDSSGNYKRMVVPIQVALDPNWEDSYTSNDDKPICNGDEVVFTGIANDKTWTYSPNLSVIEEELQLLNYGTYFYESKITLESFDPYRTLNQEDIDSIKSIEVNLEHSDMQSVKIELICPDDSVVVLKNYGGMADVGLGTYNPNDESKPGETLKYYWVNDTLSASKTMTQTRTAVEWFTATLNSDTLSFRNLTSGNYLSYENFDNLIGCTLNGDWKIRITDSIEAADNGYVKSWNFNLGTEHFFPELWTYTNTYYDTSLVWEGDSLSETVSGIATGIPGEFGVNAYILSARDDWGFMHDTIFDIEVTRPSIEIDSALQEFSGDPSKPVEFNFTNTAEWAKRTEWEIDNVLEATFDTLLTKEYTERSGYPRDTRIIEYSIFITAVSDQGCTDTASSTFQIEAVEPTIKAANIFTPNGDGTNDIFTLAFEKGNPYPLKKIQVKIFNRWGRVIKEWDSWIDYESEKYLTENAAGNSEPFFGWDGKIRNSDRLAPPGVYYYWVLAYDLTGQKVGLNNGSSGNDEEPEDNNNQGTGSSGEDSEPGSSIRQGKGKKGGLGGFFYLVR